MRGATWLGRCADADIDRVPAKDKAQLQAQRERSMCQCTLEKYSAIAWRSSHGIHALYSSIALLPSLLTPNHHLPAMQISVIQEICPEVTDLEASKALDMCSNR